MVKSKLSAAGGFAALMYVFRKGRESGGVFKLYQRLRSRNACKTCALGMGGQLGGMVNEVGHFPEVCKKSVQAQAGDMAGVITEAYFQNTPIAAMGKLDSELLEKLGRLTFPILAEANDTHYRRISWEEAYARTSDALTQADPQRVFFYSSGRSSNEAAFLMQLVARAYGTANIHNCSFYCHQASGVALNMIYGSTTGSIALEDLEKADLAIIAGANPASNHPRLITQLMHMRRCGGRVIMINPMKELGLMRFRVPSDWRSMLFGSRINDLYLQPHVGSDVALYKGILKGIVEAGGVDSRFVENYATGWAAVESDIQATSWEEITQSCGVSRQEIDEAVRIILNAKQGIGLWAMGLTHHLNGVDNVLSFCNLVMARGWLGKPGAGLMPIRGHSNVQGVGSVGVSPQLKQAFASRLEELYNIRIPAEPGQDTYASMVAAKNGDIEAAILLGGNLFGSNPDRQWSGEALRNIPLVVSLTTKLNEGHIHGRGRTSLILPVLARDEESQATTQESMFNYVRLSQGGKPSVEGEMRSEVDIIATLAERVLPSKGVDWSSFHSHQNLRKAMSQVVPGLKAIATLEDTRHEFHITGRTLHEPRFNTPDGKAQFHVTPMPGFNPGPESFRLMTLRSEGQFNTVVYEVEDLYRGNTRRDVVMMAKADATRLGLQEFDRVTVETEAGQMRVSVAFVEIPPGNLAMYYPEANVLVPRKLDERSKTPAFKSVEARITPIRQ